MATRGEAADAGARPVNATMALGLGLGLLAMSPWAVIYYWFFAPVAALLLAGALTVVAAFRRRVWPVAEGAVAAAVFGAVAVATFALALP